jgi:hypothetical protein
VTAGLEREEGLARIEVDEQPCVAYPRTTGPVAVGDDVLVNVQARALGLGSGGFDVLYANLTRGLDLPAEPGAHVMTLPYSPLQTAVRHGEETVPIEPALEGMPVICCSLHSQIAPACAAIGGDVRVAYVQVAGGALAVSLSDTIRVLKRRGLVECAVAAGSCVEGDMQCVGIHSALACARSIGIDVAVCGIGPGIVGTGTALGHGGLAAAGMADAAVALGGRAVLAARLSDADPRDRHRGVSHHTQTVLGVCLGEPLVAWPAGIEAPAWLERREEVDVTGWQEACAELPLEHMGRGAADDPSFFAAAFAAGRLARSLLG